MDIWYSDILCNILSFLNTNDVGTVKSLNKEKSKKYIVNRYFYRDIGNSIINKLGLESNEIKFIKNWLDFDNHQFIKILKSIFNFNITKTIFIYKLSSVNVSSLGTNLKIKYKNKEELTNLLIENGTLRNNNFHIFQNYSTWKRVDKGSCIYHECQSLKKKFYNVYVLTLYPGFTLRKPIKKHIVKSI